MRIGIIGLGCVGQSVYDVMKMFHQEVIGYDIDPSITKDPLEETLRTDVLFLTLPTPLAKEGRLDASSVTATLKKAETRNFKGLAVIKSTLPLGYLDNARKYRLRILYSPEFLHHNTAKEELVNPPYVLCSGSEQDFEEYTKALYWVPRDKFQLVDDRTAEMTKLAMNAFAATKISFVNEIERICRIHRADEEKVMRILRMDKRCGAEYSHPNIGPYEGTCIPKDIAELKNSTEDTILLDAVEKVNERTKKLYDKHGAAKRKSLR